MNKQSFVKNAADESQVKESQKKQNLNSENEDANLKFILGTDQGRAFLWKLLGDCGVFKSSFTGSSETFFLEGRRDIGLKLLASITRVDPDSYLKMIKQKGEF